MLDFLDRVRVNTSTTGTGTVSCGSAFGNAFCTEVEAGAVDGKTYRYILEDGNDFELGLGVYTSSGRTLTRAGVKLSKIGGVSGTTKITLSGNAVLRIGPALAEDFDGVVPQFGGRLTLTSGTAVTESDVTAATSIYATPCGPRAGRVALYDGSAWTSYNFSEMTLSLDSNSGHTGYHQSGKNFDVFHAISAGAQVIGTGPAWSSDTARGTGAGTTEIEVFEGAPVNKNSITLRNGSNTYAIAARCARLIGGFRATADGQTEDSLHKRMLSNVENDALRPVRAIEATVTWNQTTGSGVTYANGSSANKVEVFFCTTGRMVDLRSLAQFTGQTATLAAANSGIGVNSTSVITPAGVAQAFGQADNTRYATPETHYCDCPGLGYSYFAWLTNCVLANITWASNGQSGLIGFLRN